MNDHVSGLLRNTSFILALALALGIPVRSQTPSPAPPLATQPQPGPPQIGSINFVEGDASVAGSPVRAGAVLARDQVLTTSTGKVEVLLTPGVFLRIGDNSALRMVSPELTNTAVELQKGRAFADVAQIGPNNDIRVNQNGASTKLLKPGLYEFSADRSEIRVFKGKAEVDAANQKATLGNNHQLTLMAGVKPKPHDFEPRQFEDDLYRWSALRAGYLSEASVDAASRYIGDGPGWYGPGWTGVGWYWDPWFGAFTFLPADGIFYGGFGWGFYSPVAAYYSPAHFYRGGPHGFGEFHGPYGHGFAEGGGFGGRPGFGGHAGGFGGGHGGGGGRR